MYQMSLFTLEHLNTSNETFFYWVTWNGYYDLIQKATINLSTQERGKFIRKYGVSFHVKG